MTYEIVVSQSGPDIPDGVYPVMLVAIKGPKTVTAQRGPKAGQAIDLLDWEFAIDEGQYEETVIDGSTSTASGPRSRMFAYLTALLGGRQPEVGDLELGTDLVGRRALATIRKDERGWLRIENLGAMPATMSSKVTGAPLNGLPVGGPIGPSALTPVMTSLPARDPDEQLPF